MLNNEKISMFFNRVSTKPWWPYTAEVVMLSRDIDPEMVRDSNFFTLWRPAREYPNRLTAFFSPHWHELEKEDGEAMEGNIVESRKSCRKCEDIYSNAFCSNIPSGGTATAVAADKTAAGTINNLDEISEIEKQELANQIAKVRGLVTVGNA